jgi:hypothetical protein
MITTDERRKELLSKIDGSPTGAPGDPIPEDFPGLSTSEAIELEMLLSGSTEESARVVVRHAREGCPMDL